MIDKGGKRIVYYKYASWGNTVSITGSLAESVGKKNPFRYRSYYYDAEGGLYYLQSRYYDPEIRRFISADTIQAALEAPQSLSCKNLLGIARSALPY